jgi:hypothetical protein
MARLWGVLFGLGFIALGLFFIPDLAAIFSGCKAVYAAALGRDISDALK